MTRLAISEEALSVFRGIFMEAQKEIAYLLADYKALQMPGYELGRLEVIRKQIAEILQATEEPGLSWIETWLPKSYGQGSLYASKSLRDAGLAEGRLKAGFAVIDQTQIAALAESMAADLQELRSGVLLNVTRVIRRAQMPIAIDLKISKEVAHGLLSGSGVQGIQEQLLRVLHGQVVPGGYKGTLESYAELLARTRSREAQMAGSITQIKEAGVDLVLVPVHAGACEICAPWQGAILSISGEDDRFPPLSAAGLPPWHPNCLDVVVPFVEEMQTEDEMAQAEEKSRSLKKAA